MTGSDWSARSARSGGGRRYSQHDVDLLREVQRLSQDEGVNLAGIKRIIELTNQVEALRTRIKEMAARSTSCAVQQSRSTSTALVVWQPGPPGGDVRPSDDLSALTDCDREACCLRLSGRRRAVTAAAQ